MAKLSNTATANQAAFGQLGSAFLDTAANTLRAPEGMAIVAIQFLADTSLSALVAKDPDRTINTASSANSQGLFTRQVNQSNATTNKIIFDDTNAASGVAVGDQVFDSDGTLHGTVSSLDPDGDNSSEIQISASVAITDNEVLSFVRPNSQARGASNDARRGIGGQTIASAQVFPKGLTIYGSWDSVSINADDADGGVIAYFG
jgi:hypothetical protein|tara:strand:+ start:268 stop:876 length:609 start_codon:yes stop_codon:yes gene_type:complete